MVSIALIFSRRAREAGAGIADQAEDRVNIQITGLNRGEVAEPG